MGKFIIDTDGKSYSFSLKALNGETVASGNSYMNKRACVKAIESVVKNAQCANFLNLASSDEVVRAVSNPKFEMSLTDDDCYVFVLKARNGEIILTSGFYKSRQGCLNGMESVRKNTAEYEIVEQTLNT